MKDERKKLAGRKGGSKTSEAKKLSSRLNGQRGGRPKDGMLLLRKVVRDERRLNLSNVPDDSLKVIWSALVKIDKEYFFWVGDVLDGIEKRYGDASAKSAIEHSPTPGKFREAKIVSQIFSQAISQRRFNLDWRYYSEVVAEWGRDNDEECIEWLQQAEANHWTIPQLRKEIRLAHARFPH